MLRFRFSVVGPFSVLFGLLSIKEMEAVFTPTRQNFKLLAELD